MASKEKTAVISDWDDIVITLESVRVVADMVIYPPEETTLVRRMKEGEEIIDESLMVNEVSVWEGPDIYVGMLKRDVTVNELAADIWMLDMSREIDWSYDSCLMKERLLNWLFEMAKEDMEIEIKVLGI